MSVYREMYVKLFRQVSKTIEELSQVQQVCEEMYMDGGEAMLPIEFVKRGDKEPEKP